MYQALWNDVVLAESDETIRVEGNRYFPPESLRMGYFSASAMVSQCHWKGSAKYYTLSVNGRKNIDAAWYYPSPTPAAENIRNYVAFWNGVRVVKTHHDGDTRENPLVALCRLIMRRR